MSSIKFGGFFPLSACLQSVQKERAAGLGRPLQEWDGCGSVVAVLSCQALVHAMYEVILDIDRNWHGVPSSYVMPFEPNRAHGTYTLHAGQTRRVRVVYGVVRFYRDAVRID